MSHRCTSHIGRPCVYVLLWASLCFEAVFFLINKCQRFSFVFGYYRFANVYTRIILNPIPLSPFELFDRDIALDTLNDTIIYSCGIKQVKIRTLRSMTPFLPTSIMRPMVCPTTTHSIGCRTIIRQERRRRSNNVYVRHYGIFVSIHSIRFSF